MISIQAYRTGGDAIKEASETGCSCHSALPSHGVVYSLEGLPEKYEPGKEYQLTIEVVRGDEIDFGISGFALSASAGTLHPLPGAIDVQETVNGALTHTEEGTNQNHWEVMWTAPDEDIGDVIFALSVMVVNGDGVNDHFDRWQNARFVSTGEGISPQEKAEAELGVPLPAYWLGVIGILSTLALIGLAGVAVKVTHGRS